MRVFFVWVALDALDSDRHTIASDGGSSVVLSLRGTVCAFGRSAPSTQI